MAKHRDNDRIRIVPTDVEQPSHVEREATSPSPPKRTGSRPLIMVLGTLVIAVGLVVAFGGIADQEPPPAPVSIDRFSSTRVAQPEPETHLLVSAAADDEGWAVVWDSSGDPMSLGAIGAIPDRSKEFAHFTTVDSGGGFQASRQCSNGECRIRLAHADDPSMQLGSIEASTYAWHSAEPNGIAWLDRASGIITTGRIEPELGRLVETNQIAAPEGDLSMVRWDDEGFILSGDTTIALASNGSPMWSFDGRTLDANSAMVTVTNEERWLVLNRLNGEAIVIASPNEDLLEIVSTTPGDWRSERTDSGYTHSLAVLEPNEDGDQKAPPTLRRLPVETAYGAEYRIFRGSPDDTITIVYEPPATVALMADG